MLWHLVPYRPRKRLPFSGLKIIYCLGAHLSLQTNQSWIYSHFLIWLSSSQHFPCPKSSQSQIPGNWDHGIAQRPLELFKLAKPTLWTLPGLVFRTETPTMALANVFLTPGLLHSDCPNAFSVGLCDMVLPSGNVSDKFFFQWHWPLHVTFQSYCYKLNLDITLKQRMDFRFWRTRQKQ